MTGPADGQIFTEGCPERRIAETFLAAGSVRVSTVFVGLHHGGDKPVLWETLVSGGPFDQSMMRYDNRADAEAGHRGIVALVRAALVRAELEDSARP